MADGLPSRIYIDWLWEPHLGSPPEFETFLSGPPNTETTNTPCCEISGRPKPARSNAISVPSGDQAGLRSAIGGGVSVTLCRASPLTALIQMSWAAGPGGSQCWNATKFPSGERLGISSPPASCVRGTMRGGAEGARVVQNRTASAAIASAAVTDAISIKVRETGCSGFSIVGG